MLSLSYYRKLYIKFILRYMLSSSNYNFFQSYIGKKKCIVCLAADYGNLGDVAITYAQSQFLKSMLPGYEIIDFPISRTLANLKSMKKICTKDDVITIVGGGNMGDLYGDIELLRLMIVKLFPHNRIISFPQTIEYRDTTKNKFLLNLSKRVYNKHKHLLLCAREEVSYSKIKELYPYTNSCLVPDIVMTLDKRLDSLERRQNLITLCLRNDKEKMPTALNIELLQSQLISEGFKVNNRDTHIGKSRMPLEEREKELKLIWADFAMSRVVITDRLHGMIFAYITGTPAIVLPNSNFKVEKCFDWIKDCGYIKFLKYPTNERVLELVELNNINDKFDKTYQYITNEIRQVMSWLEMKSVVL